MTQTKSNFTLPAKGSPLLSTYRSVLPQTFHSPAFWCFIVLYLAAVATYLLAGGGSNLLIEHLLVLLFGSLILLAIIPLTDGAPAWEEEALSRQTLQWQLLTLLFFALLFFIYSFLLYYVLIPLWAKNELALLAIVSLSASLILFFALPVLTMRLFGSSRRELGFTRAYNTWQVILVSCALPLVLVVVLVFVGHLTVFEWIKNVVRFLLQAGFPEEVFFRGLLFTRLFRLLGTQWSLFISALIFGIIHLFANLSSGESIGMALAACVLNQLTLGLFFAVIFFRTRSILVGTVLHTLIDSLNI